MDNDAAAHRFGTSAGGSFYATSIGGVLTGKGANLLILDDLVKDAQEAYSVTARASLKQWFEHVLYPRLEPGGRIVAIGTRWHSSDLLATLLTEYAADGWVTLSLPAIAEPADLLGRPEGAALWESRFPLDALQRIRTAIGSTAFSALYQQRPVAAEGAIFRKEWLQTYVSPPECFRIVASMDTAFKVNESADYSVLQIWGETQSGYYLLDVLRERLTFPELISRTIAKCTYWRPHVVLIEDHASGQSLLQTLKLETTLPLLPIRAVGDKESRASAISPLFESGRVFIPQQATWLSDFLDELTSFPLAPHDDAVDALSQALGWMRGQSNHSYRDYQGIPRGAALPAQASGLRALGYRESPAEAQRNYEDDMIGERRRGTWDAFQPRMGSWGRTRGY
jgi:predicted phage terminase large subunit-like protein